MDCHTYDQRDAGFQFYFPMSVCTFSGQYWPRITWEYFLPPLISETICITLVFDTSLNI